MARRNMFEKSSNPMFSEKNYGNNTNSAQTLDGDITGYNTAVEPMTVNGAVNKTFILGGVMVMAAAVAFTLANPIFGMIGFVGVLVLGFVAAKDLKRSHIWAPLFSVALGFMAGASSFIYSGGGVVIQAVMLTFAILFTMLTLYKTGTIKVTDKFRSIVSMAVGAIMIVYLVQFALSFFGISIPYLHTSGPIGIGISLVIIGVASMNLLLDFDNFYKGEAARAPEHMEWYYGMGLLFTLVWLYLEIIRLVSIFSGD